MNFFEFFANAFYILSTFFASRNSLHTWWTGIVSCSLFLITFFQVKLYADVTLQVFFISTCLYGWFHWKKGGEQKKSLPITRIKLKQLLLWLGLSFCISIFYGTLLLKLTNANNPFWDSIIMSLSIFGQFLMMKRKFENWFVWIVVDSLSIPLYYLKGLYLTSLLYFVLLIIGVYGLTQWKKALFLKTE